MKAYGMFGFSNVLFLPVLLVMAVAGIADEQTSAPDPQAAPALSGSISNKNLTLSWPKSATNWLLSVQAIDARGWTYVPAARYGTNKSNIYLTTVLPAKKTFYRLAKVPPSLRNRLGQPSQTPPPPQAPQVPHPGGHPPRPAGPPPPQ